jgi:transcriptional regulator with XRE-family HTH domain
VSQSDDFAGRLRALREQAGLTQVQLAEKAGLTLQGLGQIERGRRQPSWPTVQALARALGVDCTVFADNPPPAPAAEVAPKGRKKK